MLMVHVEIEAVDTDMAPTGVAPAMRGQLMRLVHKALLHDATSVPHPTYCTLLRSPRGFTRGSPTLAAPQTSYEFWTFHHARNLILTSVNAQCTMVPISSPATRQRHQYRNSGCQRRVHSPLRYAHDPVITASKYLCRRSCLRMFLVLFLRSSLLLDMSTTPNGLKELVLFGETRL